MSTYRHVIGSLIGLIIGIGLPFAIAPSADAASFKRSTPQVQEFKRVATPPKCKVRAKAPRNRVGSACHYRTKNPHGKGQVTAIVRYTKRGTHLVRIGGEVDREIRWVNGRARDLI